MKECTGDEKGHCLKSWIWKTLCSLNVVECNIMYWKYGQGTYKDDRLGRFF